MTAANSKKPAPLEGHGFLIGRCQTLEPIDDSSAGRYQESFSLIRAALPLSSRR